MHEVASHFAPGGQSLARYRALRTEPDAWLPARAADSQSDPHCAAGEFQIVTTALDLTADAVQSLAQCLSDAERQRASRFHFARDRSRFIVKRAQLRHLLGARLGTPPEQVVLHRAAHGKPQLGGRFAECNWRFNLSQWGAVAAYAFSRGSEIGIDIEAIRPVAEANDIVARFFSRREQEAYFALEPGERLLGFFHCWTRKEAFIKAIGEGFSCPLDQFDVCLVPGKPAKLIRVGATPGDHCGWRLESFTPAPEFAGAVVTACPGTSPAPGLARHSSFARY